MKDSIRTRVVTFDTVKHFIIPIETLFKDLPFLFIKQHKLWNDVQLMIAAVTCFSWYFAANTTILCQPIFRFVNIFQLSEKIYLFQSEYVRLY